MGKKVVIVGGVAGGAGTAARLRRLDETAEIVMLERGDYISFANCGLPYYIGGAITNRDNLLVQTEEDMEERFAIDIRVRSEVTRIFRDKKEVEVVAEGGTYRESYDTLVLSPGAAPIVPPTPGIDQPRIFTLRNMADVDRVKGYIQREKPRSGVVIGGGYIGVEMAENLRQAGLSVTLVEAADQILGPMDPEMAKLIQFVLAGQEIKLILGDKVTSFSADQPMVLTLAGGGQLQADMVILAIGVRPENRLAAEAGLALGGSGGIAVDESLRTSDPDIFALGDAIEVKNLVNGQPALIPLAGPANKQARIVADNIAGRRSVYRGSQGTAILKAFQLTGAATGLNEKMLRKLEIPYQKSYTYSASHAGYYPGAKSMLIKVLFDPQNGKLLGAQIVGQEGADKRIDVLATAIRHGLTVYDLEELELAYAPPFSSAKDPVNMAGFTAANFLKGDMKLFHWDQLVREGAGDAFILDARTKKEYDNGHFPGAVNLPLDSLRELLPEIPRDRKILVYCRIGLRAYLACRILMQNGFDAYNLSGGYDLYQLYRD